MRGDAPTAAAIAIIAMIAATVAHEAIGHGTACLLVGGQIVQLTSVYFDCSVHRLWVPLGGPVGNLGAALLSLLAWRAASRPEWRLLFAATFAFSLFWAAGYLLYSAVTGEGDNAIVARILAGAPDWRWQVGLFVLGVALYRIAIDATVRMMRNFAEGRRLLLIVFASGSVAAIIAAALYAPDRMASSVQGVLEIGAASLPLAVLAFRMPASAGPHDPPIAANAFWIAAAAILFTAFAFTLGLGLP